MSENTKIAIFTIVNNIEIYNGFVDNLNLQKNISFQLFPIMNCHGEYISARKAYNEYAQGKDFKYYVFSHPDIRFLDEDSLHDIIDYVDSVGDFGVVGLAGATKFQDSCRTFTTIIQGNNKAFYGFRINKPERVQTLDECFFIVEKVYFNNHFFSDVDGWHLYSVEYCLNAELNNRVNYVIPSRVWHMSDGASLDEKYMTQLNKLIADYRDKYDVIYTTVKPWRTSGLWAYLYRKYYWIKQRIKRVLVRR